MVTSSRAYIGLDVGEKRIGVAYADDAVRIAIGLTTLSVNGTERTKLHEIVTDKHITDIIVGHPRNQSGEPTAQTRFVENMVRDLLHGFPVAVHYQDESLTSVVAEERLKALRMPYDKADIDRESAVIILQDFLESH
jgi:putative Holliday junction resolvase